MDLFAVAADNAGSLERQFDSLKSNLTPTKANSLTRFAERVKQDGRISINMRQMVLISFLTFGKHQNIYEWAQSRAEKSTKSVEEILREKLEEFYERRVAFDRHFEQRERFRYGALNIGGMGTTDFGEFCSVLADHVSSGRREVAYLRSDSLKTYLLPGPTVDEAAIRRDVAPHTHRQHLAAVKHASEIPVLSEDQWLSLLCSNVDFVEAIFAGDITLGDLEAVRMAKSDHNLFFHYAFEEFREKLGDADRFRVDGFVMILQHLEQRGIPLEVVDNV